MDFNLSIMKRGEPCHDRLADCIQDIGAAKPNAKTRCTGFMHTVAGFSDFKRRKPVIGGWGFKTTLMKNQKIRRNIVIFNMEN